LARLPPASDQYDDVLRALGAIFWRFDRDTEIAQARGAYDKAALLAAVASKVRACIEDTCLLSEISGIQDFPLVVSPSSEFTSPDGRE